MQLDLKQLRRQSFTQRFQRGRVRGDAPAVENFERSSDLVNIEATQLNVTLVDFTGLCEWFLVLNSSSACSST